MKTLASLNFAKPSGDVLGDAYEYLIGQFASESGKKAGEFYTPPYSAYIRILEILLYLPRNTSK